jgi:hypothetical protein
MNPVSAQELAQIQADAASILDKNCTIKRKTKTPDGSGSNSESWSTIATVNAGMSQPTAGQLSNYDFLIGSLSAWQVKFPVGTDIRVQDHLIINGQTLVVQVILDPKSYQALRTVLASEIK